MSISEGDTVILPHGVVGYLHKTRLGTLRVEGEGGAVWDGYDEDDLICADEPLRVRVDSEQEARELVELAAGYDFNACGGAECRHAKVSETGVIELSTGGTWHIKPLEDDAQVVNYSDRRDQVEAYIEYHSEEETMNDEHPDRQRDTVSDAIEKIVDEAGWETGPTYRIPLSDDERVVQVSVEHEPSEEDDEQLHHAIVRKIDSFGDHYFECMFCEKTFYDLDRAMKDGTCPDRQREDDADGEWDVSREIAERLVLYGEHIEDIFEDMGSWSKIDEAIREHCELSNGVCEWTWDDWHKVWDSDCGKSFQFWEDGPEENGFESCPYCGREIEITTDEGGFEVGDVIYVKQKDTYHLVREPSIEFPVIGEDEEGRAWCEDSITYDIEKVGEFKPDDDALERVNPDCNGSLFVADDKVLFDPLCRTEDIEFSGSELLFTDEGRGYQVQGAEATGIVLNFHQIAEVSDGN